MESPPPADDSGSYPDTEVSAEVVEPAAEPEAAEAEQNKTELEVEPEHEAEAEPKSKSKPETEHESIAEADKGAELEIFAETEAKVPAGNDNRKDEEEAK